MTSSCNAIHHTRGWGAAAHIRSRQLSGGRTKPNPSYCNSQWQSLHSRSLTTGLLRDPDPTFNRPRAIPTALPGPALL